MNLGKQTFRAAGMLALVTASVLVGCTADQPKEKKWQDPFFATEDKQSSVDLMLAHTVAAGAAEDATLYAVHFDGDELNSLGEQKLAAIVAGRKANMPVRVFVNANGAGERDHLDRRLAAVEQRLGKLGVYGSDGVVAGGANPRVRGSAAPAVKALGATADDAAADAAGAPAGPAGMMPPMAP